MIKKFVYGVFALALLTTTLGCPPPAPTDETVDISVDEGTVDVVETPGDNMTGTGNTTAVTEVPSDNLTSGSETP